MDKKEFNARPVFTRWQMICPVCEKTFYIDSEPEATKESILSLEDLECGLHPHEDNVLELV